MEGSSYPSGLDAFANLNLGTSPFDPNILNELMAALTATQIVVGADPADQSATYGVNGDFADFAAALKARLQIDVGSFTHPAGSGSQAVVFPNARFTDTPIVLLMPEYTGGMSNDWLYKFYATGASTTGFTSRRYVNGSYTAQALTINWLAIALP